MVSIVRSMKSFFNKPSISGDRILLLGICSVVLMIMAEANDGAINFLDNIFRALIATIVIALLIQLVRLINEL